MRKFLMLFCLTISLTTSGQTQAGVARIPIEIWNDLILLNVKVNGIEGTFIWDNGFSKTGIDAAFAEKCGIISYNNTKFKATDANNKTVELNGGTCKDFRIGSETIVNTPVIYVNTLDFIQTKTKRIDGLIGATIINQYNWNFNFDNNYVEISQHNFTQNGIKLPITLTEGSNVHLLNLKINGVDVPCRVDFGYNGDDLTMNIQGAVLFQNNKASEEYGINSIALSGFNEIDTTYIVKRNYSLEIANHTFDFLPNVYLAANYNNINLGNKFFRNKYNVVINSRNNEYLLTERQSPLKQNSGKSFGIKLLLKDNKFYIGKLSLNPNTKDKSLKLMQEVVEINGKQPIFFADNYLLSQYQKELLNNNDVLVIKLTDGTIYRFNPEYDEER